MLALPKGGDYELCHFDGIRFHYIQKNFPKYCLRHSKFRWGGGGYTLRPKDTHTDSKVIL
jgi:hypothetical protein